MAYSTGGCCRAPSRGQTTGEWVSGAELPVKHLGVSVASYLEKPLVNLYLYLLIDIDIDIDDIDINSAWGSMQPMTTEQ